MPSFAALHSPCVLLMNAFGVSTGRVFKALPWRLAPVRSVLSLRGERGGGAPRVGVDRRGDGRGGHFLESRQYVGIEGSGSQLLGTFDGGDASLLDPP
jgi:hypothetical protein